MKSSIRLAGLALAGSAALLTAGALQARDKDDANDGPQKIVHGCVLPGNEEEAILESSNGDLFQVQVNSYDETQYGPTVASGANMIASLKDGGAVVRASIDKNTRTLQIYTVDVLNGSITPPSGDDLMRESKYPFRAAFDIAVNAFLHNRMALPDRCPETMRLDRYYGNWAPHGRPSRAP